MTPKMLALVSLVAVLFSMTLFMMSSLPLLILKHDTPMDGRFIQAVFNLYYQAVFNLYYQAVMLTSVVAACSYALIGQPLVGVGLSLVAALAFGLRRWVTARMEFLRARIEAGEAAAIRKFRQLHGAGMAVNVAQLVSIVWSMTLFTR